MSNIKLMQKDIFDLPSNLKATFDYIIEYTCYCALGPDMRNKYINTMFDLLKPGEELVGIFLPLDKDLNDGGPQFGIELEETINLFLKKFKLLESIKLPLSIGPRSDIEQFIRFLK